MLQLMSYPALPSEPNRNGGSLLGPKAALQGPPSTLVLSSPHSQQLISQPPDTSPICCTPQPYPPFPNYRDAEFCSSVNVSMLLFHNIQQHLEILSQMLWLEMQTTQLQKEFWDLICTTVTHLWKQHCSSTETYVQIICWCFFLFPSSELQKKKDMDSHAVMCSALQLDRPSFDGMRRM